MNKTQIVPAVILPPKAETITKISDVAGRNPPSFNLRDHPELDGLNIIIISARIAEGETRDYVVMRAFLYAGDTPTPENLCVMITGAENIVEKLTIVIEQNAFPTSGKLRKSGRAWFID